MNDKNIRDYWPFGPTRPPRKSQTTAFHWLQSIPQNKKYILMEMPVGAGKSNTAITLSGYLADPYGNSFVLTPQRILQAQYEASFEPHLVSALYGRSNYECHPKHTNCDVGNDIKPKCSSCPYREAHTTAMNSPNMILNYTKALFLFAQAERLKLPQRKLMIFDECHTLENHLTEFNAVTISDLRCKKIGIKYYLAKTANRALEWIETDYFPAIKKKFLQYASVVEDINADLETSARKLSKSEQQDYKNYKEFKEHIALVNNLLTQGHEQIHERFVFVPEKMSFRFRELYGRTVFHGMVKPMAERFLFMSSTILNKDAFCRDLGLDPTEAEFISLDSEFPAENRPVVFMPQMKMNFEWDEPKNDENRKDMIVKIKEVCELHENESGIIHAGNFKISEWLVQELTGLVPHKIVHHNPSSEMGRDDVINDFLATSEKNPTILVSPSITEGLDLKEELARFCIFVKVPFGNLGDNWIKRRKELSTEWYQRQALINIIQGAGRIVRSADDHGNTYILDSSFAYLFNQMRRYVPNWWLDAYHEV
jgi:ATP-dependent DNA helicase DinG